MKTLKNVVQFGLFVATLISTAVPPPKEIAGWPTLLASTAYGCVIFYVKPRVETRPNTVGAMIVGSLVLGIVLALVYLGEAPSRTARYNGQLMVIGNVLQKNVKRWIDANGSNPMDYFKFNGGRPEKVWTPRSIGKNIRILGALYFSSTFLIAFAVLGALEFVSKERDWTWLWILLAAIVVAVIVVFAGPWVWKLIHF